MEGGGFREVPTTEHVEVLVVGGGQAGLAAGYYLSKLGASYVVVDDGKRVGDAWRRRWDSLRLFTPARLDALPGMPFPAPGGSTVTKDQAGDYMESYAKHFGLRVRLETRVGMLRSEGDKFFTDTGITADHVIVASGSYGEPQMPSFASQLDPDIASFHSTQYRNASQLRGDVLVVGAGNSGAEIAMDAAGASRRVWLSGRETGKVPYPAIFSRPAWWIVSRILTVNLPMGRRMAAQAYRRGQPLVRVHPAELAAAGVERVQKVAGVQEGKPRLEDGRALDVGTVVWATGFDHAYPWIDLPIVDEAGRIKHMRGVSESQPGLYFVGLPFQFGMRSSLIDGVGDDARYVVDKIAARRRSA
jgi:putative flavoprotein involved in K+ transport